MDVLGAIADAHADLGDLERAGQVITSNCGWEACCGHALW